jgi:hypothetical protein
LAFCQDKRKHPFRLFLSAIDEEKGIMNHPFLRKGVKGRNKLSNDARRKTK